MTTPAADRPLRRIVPAAHQRAQAAAQQPPAAFELEEADDSCDEIDGYTHPPNSYTQPSRRRFMVPILLLEEHAPAKVRAWDAAEDPITPSIAQWRVLVQKWQIPPGGASSVERWCPVFDDRRAPGVSWDDLTFDALRESYGPGRYRAWAYALIEDQASGDVEQKRVRGWAFPIVPRLGRASAAASPAPAAAAAALPAPAPSIALPGMPGALPAPSSFAELVQLLQVQASIATVNRESEERSEERRRRQVQEDEDRRARIRREEREDEERRIRLAREDEDLRERRELARRDREREEDDRRTRRADALEQKLMDMKASQMAVGGGTAIEQLKAYGDAVKEARQIFGEKEGSAGGRVERIADMIMGSVEPHIPAVLNVVNTAISNRQNIEQQRLRLDEIEMKIQAELANRQAAAAAAARARIPAPPPPAAPNNVQADGGTPPAPAKPEGPPAATSGPGAAPVPEPSEPLTPQGEAMPTETDLRPAGGSTSDGAALAIVPELLADEPIAIPETVTVHLPEELEPGAPCPACGVTDGCEHFPAPEVDEREECDECPVCEHGEEDEDDDGECTKCPPCPHGETDGDEVKP